MKNILGDSHFLFTSENPLYPSKYGQHPDVNAVAQFLNQHGEEAEIVHGKFNGTPENSILVKNPKNVKGLHQLAADLGQEAAIHSVGGKHEYHIYNGDDAGKIVTGQGTQFHKEEPEDNFTTIHTNEGPLHFSHNLDFSTLGKSESLTKASNPQVEINPEHGKVIANAYEQMAHLPEHPQVKAAYNALIGETKKQYQDMLKSGIKISKMKPDMENPYKTSKDMHKDIEENNHLWYLPTEQEYGNKEQGADHPMLQPTEFTNEGSPMPANDLFRVVHDYRGHYLGGKSGFGPKGEHQAYLQHKKDYSPLANKALFSETVGQNNTVNFGKNGQHNRANPSKTIYADQKAGLMPDSIINARWHNEP